MWEVAFLPLPLLLDLVYPLAPSSNSPLLVHSGPLQPAVLSSLLMTPGLPQPEVGGWRAGCAS